MTTERQPASLDLDQFSLFSATFEARSLPKFLQWDRAGLLTTGIFETQPGWDLIVATPDNITLKLEDRYTLAMALKTSGVAEEHTSFAVTDEKPKASLSGFIECVGRCLDVACDILEITEFTRIGLRLMFMKEYPDMSKASDAIFRTGLMKFPSTNLFGIDGKPASPTYILKWESEKNGTMIHLAAETRKIQFTPPAEMVGVDAFKREYSRLLYDFDYYTKATVSRGQLQVADWINSALHLARRDSTKVFEGL